MGVRQSRYFLAFTPYTAALLPASYPLIRYSSCVITRVDDTTTLELSLLNEVYHTCIVFVRVDADIAALC